MIKTPVGRTGVFKFACRLLQGTGKLGEIGTRAEFMKRITCGGVSRFALRLFTAPVPQSS